MEILHLHLLEGGFGKQHGDVLIYNPQHDHGTTEFHLLDGDELSGRLFFAFFHEEKRPQGAFIISGSGKEGWG